VLESACACQVMVSDSVVQTLCRFWLALL